MTPREFHQQIDSKKLDRYKFLATSEIEKDEKHYVENYLLKLYPELKDLWKGFKSKLTKCYEVLIDKEGKGAPTQAFLEDDAAKTMYFFDQGGLVAAKEYLIRALNAFPK